jgi:hypothetical protein
MSPREEYISFCFDENRDVGDVISAHPTIIGLHNSWTPDWYKALSVQDVLNHNSLLSRTLAYATNQDLRRG